MQIILPKHLFYLAVLTSFLFKSSEYLIHSWILSCMQTAVAYKFIYTTVYQTFFLREKQNGRKKKEMRENCCKPNKIKKKNSQDFHINMCPM